MIDDNDLARLAAMAHALRPDWPTKSLMTYLHAHHAGRPYRDIAVALAWVAADSSTQTPKRLEENGPWWAATNAEMPAVTPMPTRVADMRCGRCGNTATEPNHDEHCARRAEPGARQRAYAALTDDR
jgi:hypothetical protein